MKNQKNRLALIARIGLVISGLLLLLSAFVPMWRIDLNAPQYPEGLRLLIYPNKLGGNVDIINGLNHYIGMKTLHTEDFPEFKILPYLIWFFAIAAIATGLVAKRKALYVLVAGFVLFGVVAMMDFYKWEYDYGHNLDPNAAIIVPGMAYQPPLIGFKQLLNFGAYSIPALGGWLFVASGVLMVLSLIITMRKKTGSVSTAVAVTILGTLVFTSCSPVGPEPVKLNKDNCSNCNMTISDARFVTEIVTAKGRVLKFDDLSCLKTYKNEHTELGSKYFVADFKRPEGFLAAETAHYVTGEKVSSPMGGNTAAFASEEEARNHAESIGATVVAWKDVDQ